MKLRTIIWTSNPNASIVQHTDMKAGHSTLYAKIKLCIKGSCPKSALFYMCKINKLYSIHTFHSECTFCGGLLIGGLDLAGVLKRALNDL